MSAAYRSAAQASLIGAAVDGTMVGLWRPSGDPETYGIASKIPVMPGTAGRPGVIGTAVPTAAAVTTLVAVARRKARGRFNRVTTA